MTGRWSILALIFVLRMTMGFQFQSVPALAPLLKNDFGIGIADLGFLIGLYLSPGVALALPSGAIGRRYGDKPMVLAGAALMLIGGLMMALGATWQWQIVGRLVSGTGGVLLNVLMSKMVTDWFAGREIATAMAIFVNSWPAGIALALLALPAIATHSGIGAAFMVTNGLIAVAGLAFAWLYRTPVLAAAAVTAPASRPSGAALFALLVAGLVWGLFNAAVAMIFGFGATMLTERGWSLAAAGSATSIVLWLTTLSVPLGGVIADRTGRAVSVLLGGGLACAAMLLIAARSPQVLPAFIALGTVCGLAAGPIMSLPARVLQPSTRAVGMGIFYTEFYLVAMVAPWIAGLIASAAGSTRATFDFGAMMLLAACLLVLVFQKITSAIASATSNALALR